MEPTTLTSAMPALSLDDPSLYLNRELSLLSFQGRVLEEAEDPRHPLLERAKFLSILFSNLDEFFMVRVAGLMQIMESGKPETSMDGRTVTAQLEAIRAEVTKILDRANDFYEQRVEAGARRKRTSISSITAN